MPSSERPLVQYRQLHAGQQPVPATGHGRAIYDNSYVFKDTATRRLLPLEEFGTYTPDMTRPVMY